MTTGFDRLAAALADRYRLERELGQGGMATVYLAHDLKHQRKVAIKVLRPELAAVIGAERFLREITTIANLQHPHILGLIDSGEVIGTAYYVMPFVEGESLRDRLTREKQLPIADAVRIATEVASALDYAHRHGVIHRDIKPENVMLHDGSALVTDFGIALAVSSAGGTRMTETGMSLGTPHYMSPEQAMGQREINARSDVYALGVVTYEMLIGEPPFTGPTAQAIIAKVMTTEPVSLTAQRKSVPPAVEDAVLTALQKLPADRFGTAAEFAAALGGSGGSGGTGGGSKRGTSAIPALSAAPVVSVVLGAGLLLTSGLALWGWFRPQPSRPVFGSTAKATYESTLEIHPALSPDGRFIAYAAGDGVSTRVYTRQLNGGRPVLLTADSGAVEVSPSWSPDGSRILYGNRRGLFSVAASGGVPRQEASASNPVESAAWSPDGRTFAFVERDSVFLKRSGEPAGFLATVNGVIACRWSPDSRKLACAAGNGLYLLVGQLYGNPAPGSIVVVDVASGAVRSLTDETSLNTSPAWSPSGQWIYFVSNREGINDIYRMPAGGGRVERLTVGLNPQSITLSADGKRLAYNLYQQIANTWSVPFGKRPMSLAGATQVTRGTQAVENLRTSADGKTLYYSSDMSGTPQLYRIPVTGGEPERLVSDPFNDFGPVISPDGRSLLFHSYRDGSRDIYLQPLDGGALVRVTSTPNQEMIPDWSPDGSAVAYGMLNGRGGINVVKRDGKGGFGRPVQLVDWGLTPKYSPDGHTIVFISAVVNGRPYAVPADSGPVRLLVDSGGAPPPDAAFPQVSPDGREVLFADGQVGIWSVPFPSGGKPQLVLRFDDPLRAASGPYWTLSRDRLFVVLRESQSDIWVMNASGL